MPAARALYVSPLALEFVMPSDRLPADASLDDDDRFAHYDDETFAPRVRAVGKPCDGRAGSLTSLAHYFTKVSNGARERVHVMPPRRY